MLGKSQMKDYAPLRLYVSKRGGVRLASHPTLRDKIVGICVEEFPVDGSDRVSDVLHARVMLRLRREYGAALATFLAITFAGFISRLVSEWWSLRDSHRVLMAGWQQRAKETQAGYGS